MWQLFSLELDGEINNQGDQISGCCALVLAWDVCFLCGCGTVHKLDY